MATSMAGGPSTPIRCHRPYHRNHIRPVSPIQGLPVGSGRAPRALSIGGLAEDAPMERNGDPPRKALDADERENAAFAGRKFESEQSWKPVQPSGRLVSDFAGRSPRRHAARTLRVVARRPDRFLLLLGQALVQCNSRAPRPVNQRHHEYSTRRRDGRKSNTTSKKERHVYARSRARLQSRLARPDEFAVIGRETVPSSLPARLRPAPVTAARDPRAERNRPTAYP